MSWPVLSICPGPARERIAADMTASLPFDLSSARATLIVNGRAGRQDAGGALAGIRAALAPHLGELAVATVRKGGTIGDAARQAAQGGSQIVLAFGGDGTQNAVAGALAGTGAVMGVLPGGTFNYFARELGVETLETALAAIAGGRVIQRDLGAINGRIFLNNASFGLYPQILRRREDIYRRWGRSRLAAYWSVLVALRDLRAPMHLSVEIGADRVDFHTPLAFVARSAYQLETLGLDGADAVRAGHFALFIARGTSRRALMSAAVRLAMGKSVRGEDFELVVSDRLLIEPREARKLVALDGEKDRMDAPFRLRVLRGGLRVFAPADGTGSA